MDGFASVFNMVMRKGLDSRGYKLRDVKVVNQFNDDRIMLKGIFNYGIFSKVGTHEQDKEIFDNDGIFTTQN